MAGFPMSPNPLLSNPSWGPLGALYPGGYYPNATGFDPRQFQTANDYRRGFVELSTPIGVPTVAPSYYGVPAYIPRGNGTYDPFYHPAFQPNYPIPRLLSAVPYNNGSDALGYLLRLTRGFQAPQPYPYGHWSQPDFPQRGPQGYYPTRPQVPYPAPRQVPPGYFNLPLAYRYAPPYTQNSAANFNSLSNLARPMDAFFRDVYQDTMGFGFYS